MALPQPISGQALNWQQDASDPWQRAIDPQNANIQISYNPNTGQWDYSDPTQGVGDQASGQNPTSFSQAQQEFNTANPLIANPATSPAQTNPALVNALTQPAYNPTPTLETPTYAPTTQLGTQNVDPQLLAALSPQAAENLLVQGFQPQAQSAERNLNQTLADAGIVGGPAVAQQNALQASLAQALAPSLAGLVSGSQGNLLSAAGTGSGLQQQTGLTNAGAANSANAANVGAINTTNAGNTATYNQQQQALMNWLMQLYSQQAGQTGNAIAGGQQTGGGIAQQGAQNFQIPTGGGAQGLTGALGSVYAAQAARPQNAGAGQYDAASFAGGGY